MKNHRLPALWDEIHAPAGLSNLGPSIDNGLEAKLLKGNVWTRYAGLNFNGCVWYQRGRFFCEVWRFRRYVETKNDFTLKGLMHKVSKQYGYD